MNYVLFISAGAFQLNGLLSNLHKSLSTQGSVNS